jgi:ABC-type branched-subunit amino acid transport system ATPase component
MDPVIRTYGLTKNYGRRQALQGVDLEVPRGAVFGYLGPNGAGKTTTIRGLPAVHGWAAGRRRAAVAAAVAVPPGARRRTLGAGLAPAYGWLALTAAVFVAVAIPIFDRRDITVH